MKILLIGCEGQVAWELQRALLCLGEVVALDRHSQPLSLDLVKPETIIQAVATIKPHVIVNAAAYTAVDKAELDETFAVDAMQVNGHALETLAAAAKHCGAVLVHYSTDYVFDGSATSPYVETHPTAPQGVYARSKLLGEQAIRDAGVEHLILRTAWVYGNRGQNFLRTMLRLMGERDTLGVVEDQIGSPTWSRQIASATALMLVQCRHNEGIHFGDKGGTYHLTSAGQTSWYGFADQIYQQALQRGILTKRILIKPIKTVEFPTPAKRPAYSVLSGEKLYTAFGIRLPDWQTGLKTCLAEYPVGN